MGAPCLYDRHHGNTRGIGLAVMRLQPLHQGHVSLIEYMGRQRDRCVVVIGSAQESQTPSNPFSIEERIFMLKAILQSLGYLSKFQIRIVPDIGRCTETEWAQFVLSTIDLTPSSISNTADYTYYYCGDPPEGKPFEKCGHKITVYCLQRYQKNLYVPSGGDDISGTKVRQSISDSNQEWHQWVPLNLIPFIQEKFPSHLIRKNGDEKLNMEFEKTKYDFKLSRESCFHVFLNPPRGSDGKKKQDPKIWFFTSGTNIEKSVGSYLFGLGSKFVNPDKISHFECFLTDKNGNEVRIDIKKSFEQAGIENGTLIRIFAVELMQYDFNYLEMWGNDLKVLLKDRKIKMSQIVGFNKDAPLSILNVCFEYPTDEDSD